MGPDEDHPNIDDNAYTNFMARRALLFARLDNHFRIIIMVASNGALQFYAKNLPETRLSICGLKVARSRRETLHRI